MKLKSTRVKALRIQLSGEVSYVLSALPLDPVLRKTEKCGARYFLSTPSKLLTLNFVLVANALTGRGYLGTKPEGLLEILALWLPPWQALDN